MFCRLKTHKKLETSIHCNVDRPRCYFMHSFIDSDVHVLINPLIVVTLLNVNGRR